MPNIRRFLDLSTPHLAAGDRAYLDHCADFDRGPPTYRGTYGWFGWADYDPDPEGDTARSAPKDDTRVPERRESGR